MFPTASSVFVCHQNVIEIDVCIFLPPPPIPPLGHRCDHAFEVDSITFSIVQSVSIKLAAFTFVSKMLGTTECTAHYRTLIPYHSLLDSILKIPYNLVFTVPQTLIFQSPTHSSLCVPHTLVYLYFPHPRLSLSLKSLSLFVPYTLVSLCPSHPRLSLSLTPSSIFVSHTLVSLYPPHPRFSLSPSPSSLCVPHTLVSLCLPAVGSCRSRN